MQLFGRPESLKYSFQIENRAKAAISYKVLGRAKSIPPRTIITHTVCEDGAIVFESAGSWFAEPRVIGQFQARGGAVYRIAEGADGALRVIVDRVEP